MEKIEYTLDNSGDGEHEILGVIDESSVGSGGEVGHLSSQLEGGDEEVCAFRNADGTVTYRVLQVNTEDAMDPLMGSSSSFSSSSSQQAVLGTPINGQFYVIGSPGEMFTTQARSLAPRVIESTNRGNGTQGMKKRDDRRRATHNEVERRRRDKINNWIMKLGKLIPDIGPEGPKGGAFDGQSKGGILAKACEYIVDLKESNISYQECLKDNGKIELELDMCRQQVEDLKRDNDLLRVQLTQNGIVPVTSSDS